MFASARLSNGCQPRSDERDQNSTCLPQIGRLAVALGKTLNSSDAAKGAGHRGHHEEKAPFDIAATGTDQCARDLVGEYSRDGIVKIACELQIFLRARYATVQLDVTLPAAIALRRKFKQWKDERFGDLVNRYRPRRFALCIEKLHAAPAQLLDTPS